LSQHTQGEHHEQIIHRLRWRGLHALALVLSTEISTSAKISAPANQKQPHRLAVQDDVNDPAVMNLALNNVSNVVKRYH